MLKFVQYVLSLVILAAVVACGTTTNPMEKPPGFLPNYSLLKAMPSDNDDVQWYSYTAPDVKKGDYNAVIVESVGIYQTATESGVTSAQIEEARAKIESGIKQIVSKKVQLTDKPGVGVFQLQVMITGATLEKDSLKPWNILPVSAAIVLASKATGLDNKTPVMVIELKFVDSKSGKLLKETVNVVKGDKFRMASSTKGEFSTLATNWVQEALKYANKN